MTSQYLPCTVNTIAAVHLYTNSLGSALLFEARAGALRTLVHMKIYGSAATVPVCYAAHAKL